MIPVSYTVVFFFIVSYFGSMYVCNKNSMEFSLSLNFSEHQTVLWQSEKTENRKKKYWRKEVVFCYATWIVQ